jgi:hypothetical protein
MLDAMKGTPMKVLLRKHLAPLLALAREATVFVGAALDLPGDAPLIPAPAQTAH